MQDSVNMFLCKTVKDALPFDKLGPALPDKSVLAQMSDMLQVKK